MEIFCVKPTVYLFDFFHDFAEAFELMDEDLILTETIMYRQYIEKEKLPCKVILKDTYDTGEPKEEVIDAILQEMNQYDIHRVIGVGGGSVIDIAKLLCVENAFPIRDVIGGKTRLLLNKELIILPTTCGTGSEVTFGGIVTMKETGFKTAIISPSLSANHAVLIPELLSTLPKKVFMHCSVDALGHSIESYLSETRGNEIARAVGARSIKLILDGYGDLLSKGDSILPDLMKQFLLASCMGGMAVNNGGAGPVHALAYPLGEIYHMSHGESIYQFLTAVLKHYENTEDGALLGELKDIIRPCLQKVGIKGENVFGGLEEMLNRICPSRRLREAGMQENDIPSFVENIFGAKQRLLDASYTTFTRQDAEKIYRQRL